MFNFFSNKKFSEIQSSIDKNAIITSILYECANEDGNVNNSEINQIKTLLNSKLGLSEDEADTIFKKAEDLSKNRIELYSLSKEIRDNFDKDEIIKILEYMWAVVLADGELDDFEAALMSKAVGLLHLTGRESAEARERAKKI